MAVTEVEMFRDQVRSNWVSLRTLVSLRWVAIAGQITAVAVASRGFGFGFEVGLSSMAIGASVLANLFSTFLFPGTKRLSETEAALMLVFDVVQLGLLLFLTGGLSNPFALLIVAPVTIAATMLELRSAALLAAVTLAVISGLGVWSLPVLTAEGAELTLPPLFRFGFWLSLVIGVLFVAIYTRRVTTEIHTMSEALVATRLALSRAQKLTDIGGVVAAAAHELGTPLATIKLVSSELYDLLDDRPDLREDAALIRSQADRCRDILRSMGRAGKDDLHLRRAPFEAVVQEAAEPHADRGRTLTIRVAAEAEGDRQPVIARRPEIIHGLRNLIQNAIDFAAAEVVVELGWTQDGLRVRIEDDGPGFPAAVIARIGDPFMRRRPAADREERPGYEGMGLGLFIAKTLLERTGARLDFANRRGGGGAIVVVDWPREAIEWPDAAEGEGLGPNAPRAG